MSFICLLEHFSYFVYCFFFKFHAVGSQFHWLYWCCCWLSLLLIYEWTCPLFCIGAWYPVCAMSFNSLLLFFCIYMFVLFTFVLIITRMLCFQSFQYYYLSYSQLFNHSKCINHICFFLMFPLSHRTLSSLSLHSCG